MSAIPLLPATTSSTCLTKQGSLRPFTVEPGSYFSFFLDDHTDFTNWIPAWVFYYFTIWRICLYHHPLYRNAS
uniref:Pco061870a n=1 Tax=Arundo donax TaxID=35708 RepID=A0A0A9AE23_ARUDO